MFSFQRVLLSRFIWYLVRVRRPLICCKKCVECSLDFENWEKSKGHRSEEYGDYVDKMVLSMGSWVDKVQKRLEGLSHLINLMCLFRFRLFPSDDWVFISLLVWKSLGRRRNQKNYFHDGYAMTLSLENM